MGHTEPDGGSAQLNGEAAAGRDLSGLKRRPSETPGIHDAAKPRRVALQWGRRGSPRPCGPPRRWQSRRAETGLAATVGPRHAAAAAWDGKRKGVRGTLAALLRLRRSRVARRRIAHYNSATPRPPRGRAMRIRGAVDCIAFAGIRRRTAARTASRDSSGCPAELGLVRMPRASGCGDGIAFRGELRAFPLTGGARRP